MVAAAVLIASAAACGDDPDPKVDSPPTPTPTISTSPASGPVAPTLPPEAEGDDAAAAEAFVEYFWAMVKYAETTGEVEALEALVSPQCQGCAGGIEFLRRVFQNGGEIGGGDVTLSNFKVRELEGGPATLFEVRVDVISTRQVVSYPDEADNQVFPAGTVTDRFMVLNHDGRWSMDRWEVL
ncbi:MULTISPECIES: DUF6318 family protein [unclassified Nocardioides]|uniref:DUF6318 family protein n=1 Tax=unclassified Nocardioides TaxID=2615069 RepID=UPI001885DE4E|nr:MULTISPECIES: DUF6318 family protein [unclassified Nocardioides]